MPLLLVEERLPASILAGRLKPAITSLKREREYCIFRKIKVLKKINMDYGKICIIIPAFNAEKTIGEMVGGAKFYLNDIIVIDDGSIDSTSQVAEEAGALLIRHDKNLGKGAALKSGFEYAKDKFDAIITMDADGQHRASDIPKFLDSYSRGSGDIIIGSRYSEMKEMKLRRRCLNWLGAWTISRMTGNKIEDSQSGFRLLKSCIFNDINLTTSRFDTEYEILIKACRKGYRVYSIPIKTGFINGTINSHYRAVRDTYRICILVPKSFFW